MGELRRELLSPARLVAAMGCALRPTIPPRGWWVSTSPRQRKPRTHIEECLSTRFPDGSIGRLWRKAAVQTASHALRCRSSGEGWHRDHRRALRRVCREFAEAKRMRRGVSGACCATSSFRTFVAAQVAKPRARDTAPLLGPRFVAK